MERKRRVIIIALAVLILGALVFVLPRRRASPEPVYQGKPLSQWIAVYDPTNNVRTSQLLKETQDAIRQMGTNAIPTMLQMLRSHDSRAKVWFMNLARKQQVFHVDYIPEFNRHERAAMGLEVLGKRAESAIPELIDIYDHNPSPSAQNAIPRVLGLMGPPAKAAIPSLLRGAASSDKVARANAVYALGKICAQPDEVVPVLIKALQDPDATIQFSAAQALGSFGGDARTAVPALVNYIGTLPQPAQTGVLNTGIDRRNIVLQSLRRIDADAADKAATNTSLSPR